MDTATTERGRDGWGWRLTVVAAAVALLVGGALTSYVLLDDGGGTERETRVLGETLAGPATTTPGRGPEAPTTTTAGPGTAVTTTVAPERTSTTRPAAASPGSTVATRATTTTTVVCRNSTDPRCGPFRWVGDVRNQPLTLELRWTPANPAVGQPVTFTLTASDPDAPQEGGSASLRYGDGPVLVADAGPLQPCSRYGPWSLPAPRPGTWTRVYTHAYQRAGTFEAVFSLSSMTPDIPDCVDVPRDLGDPWASAATITASITVSEALLDRPAWMQPADNAFSFDYQSAGQRGGASSMGAGAGTGVLAFEIQGFVVGDSPPSAVLRATLYNQRTFAVAFPEGLDVVVEVTRNGQLWQTVHLRDAGVTTLGPGQQASVSAEVVLPGFGSYTLTGRVGYIGA